MHDSPYELVDPVCVKTELEEINQKKSINSRELVDPVGGVKTELEEIDLKKSINSRFKQAIVKGIISLKPFAKLRTVENSNHTAEVQTTIKPTKELKPVSDVEPEEESNHTAEVQTTIKPTKELKPVSDVGPEEELTAEINFPEELYSAPVKIPPKKKKITANRKCSKAEIGKAMYYCHVCNDHTKLSRNELKKHFIRHGMPEAVNSALHFKQARAKKNRSAKPSLHRCEVCSERFLDQTIMLEHLENHEDQFFCDTCNAGFKTLIDHTCHVQAHSDDRLFRCPLCEFTSKRRFQIRAHLYSQHEQFRKYKCDVCNKGFSVYSYLEEHKNYHTGEKPFQCDICGLSFMYTRYLNAHKVQKHTEVEKTSLECPTCKKVCRNRRTYSSHIQTHNDGKTFICDVCGKTFATSHAIATHRRLHSDSRPYKCKFCDKGFKQVSSRIDHERIHTGEKPHKCPHCGKGFTQRTSMVRHTHSHTGKRPYTCHLCKKGFIAKSVLVNHLKTFCEGAVQ